MVCHKMPLRLIVQNNFYDNIKIYEERLKGLGSFFFIYFLIIISEFGMFCHQDQWLECFYYHHVE